MMASTQPARGMRDFLPEDVRRRDYVVGVIRAVYDRYGFEPLETPAAENIETLLGKYGEEGNKLVFKILKRGEHEASGQADLALRYDLTVPFARVVAEYQPKLPKIFKRYQIQPVWRADRPARGRFREFYQCDIDSIGSTSPVVEAEQIAAVTEILTSLGFSDFIIRINHRQILSAWLHHIVIPPNRHADVLVTIDKFDKVGLDGVDKELAGKGYDEQQRKAIRGWLEARDVGLSGDWLESQAKVLGGEGAEGVRNLREILDLANSSGVNNRLRIDPTLARGLSYYTGAIMEINVADLPGSLGAGGRYDNLVGMFLGSQVPACGFSLGLERILVVMQERSMFPPKVDEAAVDVVVAAIDETAQRAALETATTLRSAGGLRVDLYPDVIRKMDKIFKYVDQRKARFIAILGGNEVADGSVSLRHVGTKKQETVPRAEAAAYVKRALSN
jgi:histidyl-tRNA synthetase